MYALEREIDRRRLGRAILWNFTNHRYPGIPGSARRWHHMCETRARRRSKLFLTLCFCINAAGARFFFPWFKRTLPSSSTPYYWLDTPETALSLLEPPTTTYAGLVNRVCNFLRIFPERRRRRRRRWREKEICINTNIESWYFIKEIFILCNSLQLLKLVIISLKYKKYTFFLPVSLCISFFQRNSEFEFIYISRSNKNSSLFLFITSYFHRSFAILWFIVDRNNHPRCNLFISTITTFPTYVCVYISVSRLFNSNRLPKFSSRESFRGGLNFRNKTVIMEELDPIPRIIERTIQVFYKLYYERNCRGNKNRIRISSVYGNVRRLQGLYNSIRVAIKSLSDREREGVMAVMVAFPFLLTSFNHATG